MATTVVSIHRKDDMRQAKALAEYIRVQRGLPVSALTDEVVERFADMLEEARAWRQGEASRVKAELDREMAELRIQMDQVRALNDALEAFVSADKILDEAVKNCLRS